MNFKAREGWGEMYLKWQVVGCACRTILSLHPVLSSLHQVP